MNKNAITGVVVGLVIGIGVTIGATALMNNKAVETTADVDTSSMTMAEMNADLKGKTGDEFDKDFISMMIEHHQGAIDMASLATTNAKHDEIKTLGKAIISAQTSEIAEMQQWQMDWGYMSSMDSMPGMNH